MDKKFEYPILVFANCEPKKVKEVTKYFKKYPWIKDMQVISGYQYNLVFKIVAETVKQLENFMSQIEKHSYIYSVCEYPEYKYATNGVKRGQYKNGAYFFLKGKGRLSMLWKVFSHTRHLVEMYEVPGALDFIMYVEAKDQDEILKQWWSMYRSGYFKEVNFALRVPEGICR